MLLKHSKIFFSLINKTSDYLQHARLSNISTVEINKIFLFADVSIKFWRNTLSPEHINHLVLCFICNFSAQKKSIQIFNKQHVDIEDKIFITKVIFANSSVRKFRQKISRFNLSRRIFDSSGSIPDFLSINNFIGCWYLLWELLAFFWLFVTVRQNFFWVVHHVVVAVVHRLTLQSRICSIFHY